MYILHESADDNATLALVPIVYFSWQVDHTESSVKIKVMYVSFCWSANIGVLDVLFHMKIRLKVGLCFSSNDCMLGLSYIDGL